MALRIKDFNKGFLIFVLAVSLGLAACAGGPINFQDGSWSTCTYTKPDGSTYTAPLQLGGAPMGFTQADGTKVECKPIPAALEPASV